MSKRRLCCVIFLALAAILATALAAGPDEALAARSKWFDFEAFKVAFRKSYSTLTEELVRRKCFLARAFRAFVSSSKYKLGLSPYYLAVNHMSDWSPKEVVQKLQVGTTNMTIKDQFLSAKARRVAVGAGGKPEDEANPTLSRRKRQPGVEWERPDPFEWVDLDYVLQSWEAELGQFDPAGRFMGSSANKNLATQMLTVNPPKRLRNGDTVFVDHRESGCLTEVRDQGECGACCIFSLVSIVEWIYCRKTERRIEFSEQYLIDCGRPFGLEGCDSGYVDGVADFVNNVGLELLEDYPYQDREERCPYDDQLHPYVARGSVRMQLRRGYHFRRQMLPVMVSQSPVLVRLLSITDSTLLEYGGGVLTKLHCSVETLGHQVLIVGHGVEGGREYWLVRNSYGQHWGEAGHMKLDKRLTARCTNDGGGVIAMNLSGAIEANFYENHLNQRQVARLLMGRNHQERKGRRRLRLRRWFGCLG